MADGRRAVAWRESPFAQRALNVALVCYLVALAWFTLGPAPADEVTAVGERIQQVGSAVAQRDGSAEGQATRSSSDVGWGLSAEEASNILVFVPLPALVALRWPCRWWIGGVVGVATSGAIELAQLVLLDHRSPQWRDLGWNSAGVALGFWICAVAVVGRRLLGR